MTKRLDATGYPTDKGLEPGYLSLYEEYFGHLADKDIALLELGIDKGGSLLLWRDYFERGIIVGLDIIPVHIDDPTGRIHVYQGYQQDKGLLDTIGREQAPKGFDVIIDDCSHLAEPTRISFWHLFTHHLKPGGIYAIEDIAVSYMDDFRGILFDGKSYKPYKYTTYDSFRYSLASYVESVRNGHILQHFPRLQTRLRNFLKPYGHYVRRIPTHDYGLVGFVKELIDACYVDSNWGSDPNRHAQIDRIIISYNRAIVLKSPIRR